MKKSITILELFSGIGGFTKGFMNAGYNITEHYYSEIDKHAIANYKYNFPNAKYIGSVTDISGRDFTGIDIITFGSPCQDFSLAGKREGMDGKRSVLILEAIRLVTELRPSVFIWENVKGAFSSNSGADFWGILQAFTNIGGYRLEWQLLNTKWFLPQNRERIYLVGHLAGRSKSGVFPIGEDDFLPQFKGQSKQGQSKQGQSQTKYNSTTLRAGNMKATDTFISAPKIAGTLTGGGNSGGLHSDMTTIQIGAYRGRNPENPTSRKSGLETEQKLEINKNGISNTLTSVQKDNVVVSYSMGSSKPGRSCINSGRVPEIGNEEKSIRRLTEIECERLQGFPDNWTKFGNYNGQIKEIPKTQRYKMLGNAVTVKVVEEIVSRIKLI